MVSKKLIAFGILVLVSSGTVLSFLFLPKESITSLWTEDPTFDLTINSPWSYLEQGDITDIDANTSNGKANFRIMGESRTYSEISGTPNSSTSIGWYKCRNENLQFPQKAVINESGCYVYHLWNEVEFGGINQTRNYPAVHFKKNVTIPLDMSDYIITTASLDVIFNATVGPNIDTPLDDYTGSQDEDLFAIGDFVTFYVLISDIDFINPYVVGYNKTKYLGQYGNGNPPILNITDSFLHIVDDQDLIRALNAAFEKDPDHSNFIITLGIDIFSEDNDNSGDHDDWEALIIKECNFTFTYERIINQFSTLSCNQLGRQVTGQNHQMIGGIFNFNYSIDKLWPSLAPLSELRFYINEKLFNEGSIRLTTFNTTVQEAKSDGFDVLSYLEKDGNISISIEVILKDEFQLSDVYTIFIDNVYLFIELLEISEDLLYILYILIGSIAGLSILFISYEKYFKYPPMVRKVRKLRNKIKTNKKIRKPVSIHERDFLISSTFQEALKKVGIDAMVMEKTEVK